MSSSDARNGNKKGFGLKTISPKRTRRRQTEKRYPHSEEARG